MHHKWTATSDFDLYEKIRRLSEITRIPISHLCDEAIEDLLIKHSFEKLDSEFKAKGKLILKLRGEISCVTNGLYRAIMSCIIS